jgi:hypothetical protein
MKNAFLLLVLCNLSLLAQQPYIAFEPELPFPQKNIELSSLLYKSPAHLSPEQKALDCISKFMLTGIDDYRFQHVLSEYLWQFDSLKIQQLKPPILAEAHKHKTPNDSILDYQLGIIPQSRMGYDNHAPEPLRAFLIDFNKDGIVDMWVLQEIMFGPSLGHYIFIRKNDVPVKIISGSGGFVKLKKLPDGKTVLTYSFIRIEDSESLITTHFVFNPVTKQTEAFKLYHNAATVLPPLTQPFKTFTATASLNSLRFSPTVIARLKDEDTTYHPARGNLVAEWKKDAKGYVLATRQNWAFVAFLPDTLHLKNSYLGHGMDSVPNQDYTHYYPNQAYLCGWIYRKNIQY